MLLINIYFTILHTSQINPVNRISELPIGDLYTKGTPFPHPSSSHTYTRTYTHMHIHIYMHIHTCTYIYTCTYTHTHVHIHARTCTCTYTHAHTRTHFSKLNSISPTGHSLSATSSEKTSQPHAYSGPVSPLFISSMVFIAIYN